MKRIGQFFDRVTDKALAKRGRQLAMLMAHWREIAGDVAAFARPERLARARGGAGLVLRLRVMPGRALEIQHMAPQLIERINTFFGHRLVERISCVQAPFDEPGQHGEEPRPPRPDPATLARLEEMANRVSDPALAAALARLAAGVAARKIGGRRG